MSLSTRYGQSIPYDEETTEDALQQRYREELGKMVADRRDVAIVHALIVDSLGIPYAAISNEITASVYRISVELSITAPTAYSIYLVYGTSYPPLSEIQQSYPELFV